MSTPHPVMRTCKTQAVAAPNAVRTGQGLQHRLDLGQPGETHFGIIEGRGYAGELEDGIRLGPQVFFALREMRQRLERSLVMQRSLRVRIQNLGGIAGPDAV